MDREKIMNGLQAIAENKACQNCCYPYMGYGVICGQEIARNALTLLKEQEVVPVKEDKINTCECGETVCRYWHPKFCGFCGRELLWY